MRWVLAILMASVAVAVSSPSALAVSGPPPRAAAAEKSNRPAIRDLLKQHADVNAAQIDGMTALHWAAWQDDQETAELLVRAGADVKAANRYGVTPLSLACTNGNGAMVALFLK